MYQDDGNHNNDEGKEGREEVTLINFQFSIINFQLVKLMKRGKIGK